MTFLPARTGSCTGGGPQTQRGVTAPGLCAVKPGEHLRGDGRGWHGASHARIECSRSWLPVGGALARLGITPAKLRQRVGFRIGVPIRESRGRAPWPRPSVPWPQATGWEPTGSCAFAPIRKQGGRGSLNPERRSGSLARQCAATAPPRRSDLEIIVRRTREIKWLVASGPACVLQLCGLLWVSSLSLAPRAGQPHRRGRWPNAPSRRADRRVDSAISPTRR